MQAFEWLLKKSSRRQQSVMNNIKLTRCYNDDVSGMTKDTEKIETSIWAWLLTCCVPNPQPELQIDDHRSRFACFANIRADILT